MVFQSTKIPFYVESFEPHADYMKDTGVWHKWGIKYQIQRYWEKQQLKLASGIVTVSNNYTEYLIKNNIRTKQLYTASCAVDISLFKFNLENRFQIREKLGFSKDQVVCVYVGKFGGLYMDVSDLKFIGSLIHFFPNLGLIILTPENKNNILKELRKITNQNFKLIIKDVSHSEVPIYLSGADFALSINKSFASGKYLSPIKVGEYWANGLPILMTEGIGDESDYLEKENGGVLFNDHNLMTGLKSLQKILFESGHRTRISELAAKYRSFDSLIRTYEELIVKE
jgi:bifunctional DNA-binding transcriptional regulator/antitoxin component of YhaV-PrlF toxin-antitoxin module